MAYIGNNLDSDIQVNKYEYTATAGQTTFACTYDRAVDVYLNGVKLDSSDFTATNGTAVVLSSGANVGDIVDINAYFDVTYANFYTQAEADARFMDINAETLPDMTGNSGKFLTTNGSVSSWGTVDLSNLTPDTLVLPSYASDPTGISAGYVYYNTTDGVVKHYDGTNWYQMTNKFTASGGTVTQSGGYTYHTFTSSGTFNADSTGTIEYLVVGGGGGGGVNHGGGGGGAGGYLANSISLNPGAYSVVIGAGAAPENNGSSTTFSTITASGGGAGGTENDGGGNSGASGGGGSGGQYQQNGGTGTSGQGYNGGYGNYTQSANYGSGGGGGGAGGTGGNGSSGAGVGQGGNGGTGATWSNGLNYAGGGGGGGYGVLGGSGGSGVGGHGGNDTGDQALPTAGATNRGGGGGGSRGSTLPRTGASGGSGIVIIRYPS